MRATLTLVCVALFAGSFHAASPAAPGRPGEFARAPSVTLPDLKGSRVKLDYGAAKLSLVNFWAVWCGPCRQEMPHIANMVKKYSGRGFKAIGIAVQSGEPSDVQEYLERHKDAGINYTILMGTDNTLTEFGDVYSVPTTFLVGPDGTILRRFVGVTPGFSVKLEDEIKKGLAPAKP